MNEVPPEDRHILHDLFAQPGDGLVADEGNGTWPTISILPDRHYLVGTGDGNLVKLVNDLLTPHSLQLHYVRMSNGGMLYFPYLVVATDGQNLGPLEARKLRVTGHVEMKEIPTDYRRMLDVLLDLLEDETDPLSTRFRILPVDHYVMTTDGSLMGSIHDLLLERGMELRYAQMPSGGTLYFPFTRYIPPSLDDMDAAVQ